MTATSQRDVVAEYFDGFRTSDHPRILATLTDDVEWVIHGHRTTRGKAEFDAEMGEPGLEGSPALSMERMVTEGKPTAIIGAGHGVHRTMRPVYFN